jgi:hypothetical protein
MARKVRHVLFATAIALSGAVIPIAVTSAQGATTSAGAGVPPIGSYVPLRSARHGSALDRVFTNMDYNGGPVMPRNIDYTVFWSPTGLSAYGPTSTPEYVTGIEQFFRDLAHDSGGNQNVDSVSAQYKDLTGAASQYLVTYAGAIVDTDPYPTSTCPVNAPVTHCLDDAQLQSELQKFTTAHHLPQDLAHEYFLLTPPHVEGCFTNNQATNYGGCTAGIVPSSLGAYCAYHENTTTAPMLFYADQPYVSGNAGCDDGNHPNGVSDGALEGGLSHEQNESVSDPVPNDAWTNGYGTKQGMEIGDQCDGVMGATLGTHNGASYNQVINGHYYWFQTEWSNRGHACLQRLASVGTPPLAKMTVTHGAGNAITFDASGSSNAGGIADYVWQFNAVGNAQTVEQTTPKITYTFPSSGAYSVGLTVFAKDGTSAGTGGIVMTGHSGYVPGFTFAPTKPAVGTVVHFAGLSTISRFPVLNYLWEFGDGTTASGRTPTHTYTKAGTYPVVVVEFSGVGSAFPGTGACPIYRTTVVVS